MATLQIMRGKKVNLPVLKEGEFGYCTDTEELYIGTTSGNVLVTSNMDPENLTTAVPIKKGGTGATTAAEALVNLGALAKEGDGSNVITKFTTASSPAELTTGEKLSASFGKITKAISSLISHLADKNNPHGVTSVTSAAKLTNTRIVTLSGVVATAQNFNGESNLTIPVTAVPASLLTGTVPVGVLATNSTDYTTSRIRNISASTAAVTSLANGAIHLQYEA